VEAVLGDTALVAAVVDVEATVKATGRRIKEQGEVHLWRFDDRGKVARFRHVLDTAQHERAWRAHDEPGR
jgi:ketosteroid isomerase-like protein